MDEILRALNSYWMRYLGDDPEDEDDEDYQGDEGDEDDSYNEEEDSCQ